MSRDALIVGISHYQYLPGLRSPATDAEAIAQNLTTFGNFRTQRLPEIIRQDPTTHLLQPQISTKKPVTLQELEIALVRLFKPAGKTIPHTALFYFSGHGLQKHQGIQEGYLATSDTNPDQGNYGLSLFWLRRLLLESPVPQRVILLDCCHSGELLNFLEADPGARSGTDRLFMAASREYEAAFGSLNSPYSVFTQALLTGLDPSRADNGVITNHGLTDWVNRCLKGELQQPLFENSGSEIVLTQTQPLGAAGPSLLVPSETPQATLVDPEPPIPLRDLPPLDLPTPLAPPLAPGPPGGTSPAILIEHLAQEWLNAGQPKEGSYLLRGHQLIDAEQALHRATQAFSPLACQYITVSQQESQRSRRESMAVQLAVPMVLLTVLSLSLVQYHWANRSQGDRDRELQLSLSRQWASVSQSLLQESDGDPTTALLISRLAAERGGYTQEVQASLRAALQKLQLQFKIATHLTAVTQVEISPTNQYLATVSPLEGVQVWNLQTQQPTKLGQGEAVAFNPQGDQLAVLDQRGQQVQVWSLRSDPLQLQRPFLINTSNNPNLVNVPGPNRPASPPPADRNGSPRPMLSFSPDGQWLVTAVPNQPILISEVATGRPRQVLEASGGIVSLEWSGEGQKLLVVGRNGGVQVWAPEMEKPIAKKLPHPAPVAQATLSRDGQTLATITTQGQIRLWQLKTGKLLRELDRGPNNDQPTPGGVYRLFFTTALPPDIPQGERTPPNLSPSPQRLEGWLVIVGAEMRVWNLQTGEWQNSSRLGGVAPLVPKGGGPIALSPNHGLLATTDLTDLSASNDRPAPIYLQDVSTHQVQVLKDPTTPVQVMQFSPDGAYLAAIGTDGILHWWTTQPGGELPLLNANQQPLQWFTFTSSGPSSGPSLGLVAATRNGWVQSWRFSKPEEGRDSLPGNDLKPMSPSDRSGEVESRNPQASMLPMRTIAIGAEQFWGNIQGTWQSLNSLFLAWFKRSQPEGVPPDSGRLLPQQAPIGQAARETGLPPMQFQSRWLNLAALRSLGSSQDAVLAVSPDQQTVAMVQTDGSILVGLPQPDGSLQPVQQISNGVPLEPEFDLAKGRPQPLVVRDLAFSRQGQLLLAVAEDNTVYVWHWASGKYLQALRGHRGKVRRATFSADGRWVVTASEDHTAQIWEVGSGRSVKTLAHPSEVTSADFSPDGQRVVTAGQDGLARIWNLQESADFIPLVGHALGLRDAHFSPDGQLVVTASEDGTARLWDSRSGKELAQFRMGPSSLERNRVLQAAFSPDGQLVATLSQDGKLRLWAATWGALVKIAQERSFRKLTPAECTSHLQLSANKCSVLTRGFGAATAP